MSALYFLLGIFAGCWISAAFDLWTDRRLDREEQTR